MKKFAVHYPLVMTLTLAFVFAWFGINEILSPRYWSGYVPPIARELLPIPILPLVQGHGVILTLLALALIFKFYLRYTGFLCVGILITIIVGLIELDGFTEIVVRDIGLLGLALTIWLRSFDSNK